MAICYRNAQLIGKQGLFDFDVEDGRFGQIRSADANAVIAPGSNSIDLEGRLVSSPFCDTHLHLDYVYTSHFEAAENSTGTLFEGISRWHDVKQTATVESVKERASRAIREEVLGGTQHIRSHVDVTDPSLTGLSAMLELREEMRDLVDIQIVAFPQEGLLGFPRGAELVEEALKMGADAVGAIPHYELTDADGAQSLRHIVDLAVRYGKRIDVHCDETDDPMSRHLQTLAALVHAADMGTRTTASHTCSLGSADNAYFFKLLRLLKMSQINFVVAPAENLYLQGRQDTYPKRRGVTRVKELLDEGVNVSLGQDSICDPWYPLGDGSMLNVLDFAVHVSQLMSLDALDTAFDLITTNGAITLGLEEYGIGRGKPANFVVLDAPSAFDALRRRSDVIRSVRHGRTLFSREPARITSDFSLMAGGAW